MHRRTVIAALATLPALPVLAAGHGRIFTFTGASGHTCSGRAEIEGTTIHLLDDFMFDGGPDVKVALGRDGQYDAATLSGPLQSNSGASTYTVPAGVDPAAYNEVWLWCEQYNVGLAVARA